MNVKYRLLQRYQNVKAELEAQQNLEKVKLEKTAQITASSAKSLKTINNRNNQSTMGTAF